jgi:hypothetical protein
MDKPAVISGVYVDCKFMAGFKVARISIDIPIEHSNEFLRMFGAPDRANPVHVAVARLQEGASAPTVPEKAVEPAPVEKAETKRSNLAAILCKNSEGFQAWLVDTYWTGKEDIGDYDGLLKRALGITSKTEIDTNPDKAEAWERMLTTFKHRNTVRA